jgi:hypothetical protein
MLGVIRPNSVSAGIRWKAWQEGRNARLICCHTADVGHFYRWYWPEVLNGPGRVA